jgi:protein ImuB
MRVPSYDDLTPSIPDVSPLDVFASVERLMPASPPVAGADARAGNSHQSLAPAAAVATLFACVYTPEPSPAARERLGAIASAFSPRLERYGEAAVVLDVSGLSRLLGDGRAIGAEIDRAARASGGRTHVAVASTQTAALLLALARPALTVVSGDVAAALTSVPLTFLERFVALSSGDGRRRARASRARHGADAGPPTTDSGPCFETLRRWGLTTIGELAALPAVDLSARMGEAGVALHRTANGIDPRPLVADPGVPRFIQSMELEWPIDGLEPLSFVLARLLDPLAASLERAARGAAAIRLDLRLVDRTMHARALQLPAAMRDPRVLRTLLLLDLESHPPSAGIDAITIEVDPAPARIIQYSLLERATPSAETIATLTARLNALVGAARCGTPVLVDTHRPDGFELWQFAGSLGAVGARTLEPAASTGGFDRSAEAMPPVLRRFRPPVALRVAVEGGRPVRIAIHRRGMPGGCVDQASGPWRTSGGWWEEEGRPWDRDEWDLALSDGSLCRVFRDRLTGVWFLEGVFD